MSEGTTLYCGDNCNHTGPHRYPPAVPADPPSPRYIVDRETLIAAYESQAWSSPDQMADMLLDGLALASSPAPAGLDESPAADDEAANQWQAMYPNVSYAARVAVRLWNRLIVAEGAATRPAEQQEDRER